jgi:hypothetical protein
LKGIGAGENTTLYPNYRTATIDMTGSAGNKIDIAPTTLIFDGDTSSFQGTLNPNLTTGIYQIKVKLDTTLTKKAIIAITAGKDTKVPTLALSNGDLNGDNTINLIDYNIMISCYGGKACESKIKADLNMDAIVDERDINLFYAEFRVRQGD